MAVVRSQRPLAVQWKVCSCVALRGGRVSKSTLFHLRGSPQEAAELKHAGQDPSRLLDKSAGSFRARQQEEKRRNMVNKELPRVTEKLRKAIGEWEDAAAEPFVYMGRPYSEIMEEQRLEVEREVEEERLRREEERQRIKAKVCLQGHSCVLAQG